MFVYFYNHTLVGEPKMRWLYL